MSNIDTSDKEDYPKRIFLCLWFGGCVSLNRLAGQGSTGLEPRAQNGRSILR